MTGYAASDLAASGQAVSRHAAGRFSLEARTVTILGWARSGRAAARIVSSRGARVFVSDAKPREKLDAASLEELAPFAHELGGHTTRALESDLVILSPGIPPDIPILRGYRGEIWSELELAYRVIPCPIIAITGTNGKTTTTTLIGEILERGWKNGKTHVAGNIGRAATNVAEEAKPEDICVLETSSFQLETIREFRPTIAVWLNLRSDHLDRYLDIDAYQAAKERIFMNMGERDTVIINIDDPRSAELAARLKDARNQSKPSPIVLTLSATRQDATREDDNSHYDLNLHMVNLWFDKLTTSGTTHARPELVEGQALQKQQTLDAAKAPENLLAAIAVARLLGIAEDDLTGALADFKGLPHRIERVGRIGNVIFYDDSKATNVHSVEAALNRIDPPIVLLMGGRDKGENYSELRSLVKSKCRAVVSYGEASDRIASMLGGDVVPRFDDAVRHSFQLASPDAAVLLSPACSSYDQFTDYAARGDRFKSLVRELGGAQ